MNRLKDETSPYLLQHADNPVDWYPWGEEAFTRAQAEDKPILLSVGYSACHWCHVMAHESFEHGPTAELMNKWFINVKVDREERPDVDDIYMQAVQAMTRHGGWPMTVFLLPDGRPFYGGTYFPLERRYGMPSFREVLQAVHEAYMNRRTELEAHASELAQALNRDFLSIGGDESVFDDTLLDEAAKAIVAEFDPRYGGFGTQPKFPNPMNHEFLLRAYMRTGRNDWLHVVTHSLRKMAAGGIYDQIGGGFARYSVDAMWLVPHFEKMLYDNAQLSRLYVHTYQVTNDLFFRQLAEDIYDYILREMTAPEGGFYSSTDADSEGEEGKFFVWAYDEIKSVLAELADVPNAAAIAIEYWGITRGGNFEGKNILYVPNDKETVAERVGISVDELDRALVAIRDKLYAHRTGRIHPNLDDKILTAWNGMMIASLAEAGRALGRSDYISAAERAGDFIRTTMTAENGRLYRTYSRGQRKINAYLEDYAHLIDAYLELYQSSYNEHWFIEARRLADVVLAHFRASDGGFYDTSDDHEQLIVRPRNLQDNATPSGNAMMAKQLLRLAAYTADPRYDEAARGVLRQLSAVLRQVPQAFGEALNAAEMAIHGLAEVAIVGNPTEPATKKLLQTLHRSYRPNVISALTRRDNIGEAAIPLLGYRTARNNQPTVYVCKHFACAQPVNTAEEMVELLRSDS